MNLYDVARHAGLLLLPPEGGWVMAKGNPDAARGFRIPRSIAECGVRHLDIYWGYDEKLTVYNQLMGPADLRGGRGQSMYKNIMDMAKHDMDEAAVMYIKCIKALSYYDKQISLITINAPTPTGEKCKFWNGELSHVTDMQAYLSSEAYEPIGTGQSMLNPIIDEAIRDMVDSLMIDGLNVMQARDHAINARILKKKDRIIPATFYRPIGWFKERFVEDCLTLPPEERE